MRERERERENHARISHQQSDWERERTTSEIGEVAEGASTANCNVTVETGALTEKRGRRWKRARERGMRAGASDLGRLSGRGVDSELQRHGAAVRNKRCV